MAFADGTTGWEAPGIEWDTDQKEGHAQLLASGEKLTAHCAQEWSLSRGVFRVPLTSADIDLIVHYKWPRRLWRHESRQRFVTLKRADGTLEWVPQAESNVPGVGH
jgi:hypothetical protein